MTYETDRTISELLATIARQRSRIEELRRLPLERTHQRPERDRWSVAEILEHMNLSSGHYLKRLQRVYGSVPPPTKRRSTFEPGHWGEKATKAMLPSADGRIPWRMKTLWLFEPKTARIAGHASLERFIETLDGFTAVLVRAREVGWDGPRITSTLGPLLRFKICDAIRFPIAHQERHMVQIERTLAQVSGSIAA